MCPVAPALDPRILEIARAVGAAGGRALVVGGFVRDRLLRRVAKDLDVEVYGLRFEALEGILSRSGEVVAVGRSFGVLRVKGIDCDFSLPRRDSKEGRGHRGFLVELDPELDFAEAARRRDLTINSMGWDPLRDEVLDPHGGRRDLERRVLRATDPRRFAEDPLRGLRVAQLAARFEMEPDAELCRLAAALELSELPGERVFEELRKLLLEGRIPSRGLRFLERTGLLRFFPELRAMVGVEQDRLWHPEGDVWEHTLLVVDEAARMRQGGPDDLALMFGALLHDAGKPLVTAVGEDGRIRSPRHEAEGVAPAESFLERLRAPGELKRQVAALVRYHLAPAHLRHRATARAYRRLARRLDRAGVSARLLALVARADHLGRTTADARARRFPAGEEFLRRAEEIQVADEAPRDAVMGRHLIARGLEPGPHFGAILSRCREVQDETGWEEPEAILDRVLGPREARPGREG